MTVTREKVHVRHVGKSHNAHRWVAIPDDLAFIGTGKGFVIGGLPNPLNPKTLSDKISRLFAGSLLDGVPYGGGHALRRTYGQRLLESGVDPVTAAALMGHDPTQLLREYAASREDLKRDAVKKAFGG